MKQTKLIMGMPVSVEIVDNDVTDVIFTKVYSYFTYVDNKYSTYKKTSEISRINQGLSKKHWSKEMRQVLDLCAETKQQTNGYFNIQHNGMVDPSGLVKGWAIKNAADIIVNNGFNNFCIEAGGDIQVSGQNSDGESWYIGIRNPFNKKEIIKTICVTSEGVATSGTYIRGQHIYDPQMPHKPIEDIIAVTVIGPDIYNADRFATAAYAMGKDGINFIESLEGYEAYMIDTNKTATLTSGFDRYVR